MSETGSEINSQRPPLSRRSFLKLLGFGGVTAASIYLGLDKLDAVEEKLSQMELSAKVNAGAFISENLKSISMLEDLKKEITEKTEALKGISAAGLYLSDIDENAYVKVGNYTEKFIAASLVKIPLMYQVWQKGEVDGVEYLTKDVADRILGKSESCGDFLMNLPFNKDRKSEEVDSVINEMLSKSGITPEFDKDGNIKVNLNEYFGFLRKTELPSVMKEAMRQTKEDDANNYGVSTVLRENSKGENDIFFKIGLAQEGNEVTNSYVFMLGENIKAVGYARGKDVGQVHEQMLYSGALIAKYSSK